ncbi:MAG: crossover junction endodeoxyribonuclease RuvC [Actinobacteria bacterium]|nr:crossover junction endodeoxyribonuclease RuvC [Actinomycetota bacterium]
MFDGATAEPVLGIDPGLSRCGYGVVRRDGHRLVPVAYGVLRTPTDLGLAERLAMLQHDLEELLDDVAPAALAVERILFQVNARTAISVGQASGLALAAAARRGIPVTHYSPNEVKLAVTGYGGAEKAQVQEMVARLCHLDAPPSPPDAADALALAICHLWAAPAERRAADAEGRAGGGGGGGLARAVAAALAREEGSR